MRKERERERDKLDREIERVRGYDGKRGVIVTGGCFRWRGGIEVKKKQKDRDNDRDIMKHRTGRFPPPTLPCLF